MFLQRAHILSIALDSGVCEITNERNEADEKVKEHVEGHEEQDVPWKPSFDFVHFPNKVQSHGKICAIADDGNKTNDRGPAEADAAEAEEGKVEAVGGFAGARENVGVVFWDVCGDLLLDLFGLVGLRGVGNNVVVGVLHDAMSYCRPNWDKGVRLMYLRMANRVCCPATCSCTCPSPWTASSSPRT
jgi:hypothetical protein